MHIHKLTAAMWLILSAPFAEAAATDCTVDREALMVLSYDDFDQSPAGGWRPLGNLPSCHGVVADLIRDYRTQHELTLSSGQRRILNWHEGQIAAMAALPERAIRAFQASRNPQDPVWTDYVDATIAFMRQDRAALLQARERLAQHPAPDTWAARVAESQQKFGFTPSWPMNLNVVDQLVRCFDSPYQEAYGKACATPEPLPNSTH